MAWAIWWTSAGVMWGQMALQCWLACARVGFEDRGGWQGFEDYEGNQQEDYAGDVDTVASAVL